jgi:magnesium-transporting ATPase (P-type)
LLHTARNFAHRSLGGLSGQRLCSDIDFVIRLMVLRLLNWVFCSPSLTRCLRSASRWSKIAAIVALIPQGLFFMTTVTCAMGAVRMAAGRAGATV